jgi:hypothetical protein
VGAENDDAGVMSGGALHDLVAHGSFLHQPMNRRAGPPAIPVSIFMDWKRWPSDNTEVSSSTDPSIEEALRAGFDITLMELNLSLPPEERWRQHDMALNVILELEQARMARDAGLQSTVTPSD